MFGEKLKTLTMNRDLFTSVVEETIFVQETPKLYEIKKINTNFERKLITCSNDSEQFIRQFYFDDIDVYESFFLLLLDRSMHTIGYAKISQGGISATIVDPRLVAKYAIDSLASVVILAHNHPSGNTEPSMPDIQLTIRIKQCMELFDIKVVDHLILTRDSKYSFGDAGKL